MKKFLARAWRALSTRSYVIIDPRDSSLTMSRRLWRDVEAEAEARGLSLNRVYVFALANEKKGKSYAFCVDPKQFADVEDAAFVPVQMDVRTKHVGFALTLPTGAWVCMDYAGQAEKPLRVAVRKTTEQLKGEVAWVLLKG